MRKTNLRKKVIALILILSISIPSMVYAIQSIEWPDEIERFEKYNTVFSGSMELGEDIEDAELPESLRGIVCIPDDMDVDTFTQAEPTIDTSTGTDYYDYYDYGYVKPSDAAEDYASGDLVIYSIFYASEDGSGDVGSIEYRIYGSLEGSSEVWFVCDIDGNITGAVIDIPVTWVNTGTELDNEVEGDYTFEAVISDESDYTYSGDMPTAVVSVYDVDSHDVGCDCDACLAVSTTTHESYYTETVATETASEDYGISTMALTDTDDYTYGTDDTGELLAMRELISEYVTENIATSGNASFTTTNGVYIPGTWVDYLNTIWYNVVGATSTDSEDGSSDWVSSVQWTDTTDMQEDGDILDPWTGTGADASTLIYDSTKLESIYSSGIWKIYCGEQLLYALLNYNDGDTISLQKDIDLNGQYYNWPGVTLTESVTIDGNGYTIYNLGTFIDYSEDITYESISSTYTRGGFVEFKGNGATFVVEDLNFESGKIYADTGLGTSGATTDTNTNLALFMIDERWGAYDFTVTMEDVHVDNYLVCSNASSNAVLLAMYEADTVNNNTTTSMEYSYAVDNCSVSNSYVYGNNHVSTMGTFTSNISFTNCYSVDNVIVGTGFHSGSFVSCLNGSASFDSCFAANNYMYSATQSGGFVGYGGDSADYTNCYASGIVEGYSYLGGFVGATSVGYDYDSEDNYEVSRNYNTFTNCYSTTLVGMRTETQDSGGFVGIVYYHEDWYPTDATAFDSCYAAGEVGSTQTVTETNSNYVGGFVGYDQTYTEGNSLESSYQTEYMNCYYDKQTTAMREWVSGRYNSTSTGNMYDIDISGVLTSDTEKYGTGLTSEPNTSVTEYTEDANGDEIADDPEYGFIGFTDNDEWEFVDEHYPQLDVFASATSTDWANPELVQAYSLASTATVILDTWDYGYNWDADTGIRSATKELYYGTFNTTDDHVGDRYTYDTVREVVSNATITDTATFEERIGDGLEGASYMMAEATDGDGVGVSTEETTEYNGINAFTLDNDADSLTVDAPGIDWYIIDEEDDTGAEVGTRPIRLISFMKVDAGADVTLTGSDVYDHKDDAYFTMIDTLEQNMIVGIDDESVWATSLMQSYPETNLFYAVDTLNTGFTASSGAWINTEIWRAEPLLDEGVKEEYFTYNDDGTYTYTNPEEDEQWLFYFGQDGVLYCQYEDGTVDEIYVSEDGTQYYTVEYSVNIYGLQEDEDMTTTQAKWNGEIPMYPDLGVDQYYVVRYYWVLDNGRYRSDYKIVSIDSDTVDLDEDHNVTIQVFNDADESLNSNVMALYATGYESESDTEYESVLYSSAVQYSASTDDYYSTLEDGNDAVAYGQNSYVAWNQLNDNAVVTKYVLTMTSNVVDTDEEDETTDNGYIVGTVTETEELEAGDTITIPIEVFYFKITDSLSTSTVVGYTGYYQSTESEIVDVEYEVQEAEDGGLYIDFSETTTVHVDDGSDEGLDIVIDDTSYNITFDIYVVEEGSITVKKEVENYEDTMSDQSFIINLEGLDTQIALKDGETSLPIYTSAYDDNNQITFYVDETVPMEFALDSITYTINGGASVEYNPEDGITMTVGDDIAILVTNTYEGEAYFKDRDEEENTFTSSSDDE